MFFFFFVIFIPARKRWKSHRCTGRSRPSLRGRRGRVTLPRPRQSFLLRARPADQPSTAGTVAAPRPPYRCARRSSSRAGNRTSRDDFYSEPTAESAKSRARLRSARSFRVVLTTVERARQSERSSGLIPVPFSRATERGVCVCVCAGAGERKGGRPPLFRDGF